MRKVAIFRNTLLASSETFIKEQARALTNWSPILIGYQRDMEGLDLHGMNLRLLPGMVPGKLRRFHLRYLRYQSRPHTPTVKALKSLGVDLVHAHFGLDATDIWPSAKALGLPMLVTLHGYDINIHRQWWESGKGGWWRRRYPAQLLQMSRDPQVRFIAVSKAIKDRAVEYGIPESKVSVAYIGVDTERFQPGGLSLSERPNRVLFVGRMVEKKAPLLMVRSFAKLRNTIPDAQLVMAGDGPLLNATRKLAITLDIPIEFLGVCTADEVLAQLHQAAVLCLPSVKTARGDAEGFGLVLLEAQACGVPVVTSALGGATEAIVPDQTGFAFDPGDEAALARRLVSILQDPEKRTCMSAMATTHARTTFDLANLTAHLEDQYTAAANTVAAGTPAA